jgi:hypothetical protein|tara:strand:+ start:7441 stop:8091 length:651 start_codon:yes stop_codon:yes gene_type:complete
MALESVTHLDDLVATNPTATDPVSEGDDHVRNIKTVLLTDFPNITGVMTATQAELNVATGVTAGTVTASKALVVDSASKLDIMNIDNITINSNDISSTDTNGNITITPNGTGKVSLVGGIMTPETTTSSGAGAVAITGAIHEITTDSADALTLADGAEGQHLYVVCVDQSSGDATLTPTNFAQGTTITFADDGDACHLLFTAGEWYVVGNQGCAIA